MKVLVFGGTTEGRLLARELSALGAQVTVSVATALGAEELRGVPPLTVCVGRKDTRQMREMLPGFAVCEMCIRDRGYAGPVRSLRTTGRVYGGLLAHSFRRAQACFDAMECRCYDGGIRFLTREKPVRAPHALVCGALTAGMVLALVCGA